MLVSVLGTGLENQVVVVDNVQYHLSGLVDIIAIADAHSPLKPARMFPRVIVNSSCRESTIGNYYRLIVVGGNDGVENLNLLDCTFVSLKLDEVAHTIRFQKQDEHSSGKVLQRAT